MDSPIVTRIFRRLFAHETCCSLRTVRSPRVPRPFYAHQCRRISTTAPRQDGGPRQDSNWQQRLELLPEDKSEEFKRYPMVTADMLRNRKQRPRRVKMLMRDFIEGNHLPHTVETR